VLTLFRKYEDSTYPKESLYESPKD